MNWSFIFSVAGIFIGWLLAQAGQSFRLWQEDRKSVKRVLFNLLETYYTLDRLDIDKQTKPIKEKLLSFIRVNESQPDEQQKMLDSYMPLLVKALVGPSLAKEMQSIRENYQKSVETLSAIDPLTAYYLSRRPDLISIFDSIETLPERLQGQSPSEQGELQVALQLISDLIKPEAIRNALGDLEADIFDIAGKIGRRTRRESSEAIERLKMEQDTVATQHFEKLLQKVISQMGRQSRVPAPENTPSRATEWSPNTTAS